MANVKSAAENSVLCHDCQCKIKIENKKLKNGCLCVYNINNKKIQIYKCKDCFNKNTALTNFQDCEVYSRVVGYLRPVKQWNESKQKEYNDRITYKTSKEHSLYNS